MWQIATASNSTLDRRGDNLLFNIDVPKSQFMDAINFEAHSPSSSETERNPAKNGNNDIATGQERELLETLEEVEQNEPSSEQSHLIKCAQVHGEPSSLTDRFEQLRRWQQSQQEQLMSQQRQQLERLRVEQQKVEQLMSKQGSTGKLDSAVASQPLGADWAKMAGRSQPQNYVDIDAAEDWCSGDDASDDSGDDSRSLQPSDAASNIAVPPKYRLAEPSPANTDEQYVLKSPKRFDMTKNTRRRLEKIDGTNSETGSYSPPVRKTLPSKGSLGKDQRVHLRRPTEQLDENDDDNIPEPSAVRVDDLPVDEKPLPGLGASSKTFQQLIDDTLHKEQMAGAAAMSPTKRRKTVGGPPGRRVFLKRGEGIARFGPAAVKVVAPKQKPTSRTTGAALATKPPVQPSRAEQMTASSSSHPPKRELQKGVPQSTREHQKANPSPLREPQTRELQTREPQMREPQTREPQTREPPQGKFLNGVADDISFQTHMLTINHEVEEEELEEFEILEQYADDNASFLSNVSRVNRVLNQQKSTKRQCEEQPLPNGSLQSNSGIRGTVLEEGTKDVNEAELDDTLVETDDTPHATERRHLQRKVARRYVGDTRPDEEMFERGDGDAVEHPPDRGEANKRLVWTPDCSPRKQAISPHKRVAETRQELTEFKKSVPEFTKSAMEFEKPVLEEEEDGDSDNFDFEDTDAWEQENSLHEYHEIVNQHPDSPYRAAAVNGSLPVTSGDMSVPRSRLVSNLFPALRPPPPQPPPQVEKIVTKPTIADGVMSKALREKLLQLEGEIERFRLENATLEKLRKERQQGLDHLQKEMAEFEKQKNEEMKRFQEYKLEETKKLRREKKLFAQFQKTAKEGPDKKERVEMEKLKTQLSEVEMEMRRKEERWTASAARLRDRVEVLDEENRGLKEEIALAERRRLQAWQHHNQRSDAASDRRPEVETKQPLSPENAPRNTTQQPPSLADRDLETSREDLSAAPHAIASPSSTGMPRSARMPSSEQPDKTVCRRKTAPNLDVVICDIDKGDQVYEETQHADGKIERVFSNSVREIIFPNGTCRRVSADGQSVIVSFFNGDIKQTLQDRRLIYYYADAQTTHTTYPDGVQVLKFANNQIEKHYPDGTREITFPDQTVKYLFANETEQSIFPDGTIVHIDEVGTKTMEFVNGQREIHTKEYKRRDYPDGTVKTIYPDGRQETRYSSGRLRIKDEKGNVLVDESA